MRKSSFLLPALGSVAVFGVTAWWLERGNADEAAVPGQQPAEAVAASAHQRNPGNTSAEQSALQVATAAARSPVPFEPALPAAADPVSDKAWGESDLEQMRNGQQQEELRRQDPEYRRKQDEYRRRYAERLRADAIRVAGMTDGDVDQVFEFGQEKLTALRALIAASYGRPAQDVFAEARRLHDEYQEKLRGFLEPEKYERWDWYHASQGERNEARQFSRDLTRAGDAPMQPEQMDTLVEALYAEERRWEKEYDEYIRSTGLTADKVPPRSLEYRLAAGKARNQRIHDAMAGTLSRSQVASLDRMLAGKLAYLEDAIRYNQSAGTSR